MYDQTVLGFIGRTSDCRINYRLHPLRPLLRYMIEQSLGSSLAFDAVSMLGKVMIGAAGVGASWFRDVISNGSNAVIGGTGDRWYQWNEWHQPLPDDMFTPRASTGVSEQRLAAASNDTEDLQNRLQDDLAAEFQKLADTTQSPVVRQLADQARRQLSGPTYPQIHSLIYALLDRPDLKKRLGIITVHGYEGRAALRFGTDRLATTRGPLRILRTVLGLQRREIQVLARFDTKHDLPLARPVSTARIGEAAYMINFNPWADPDTLEHELLSTLVRIRAEVTSTPAHVPSIPTYLLNRLLTATPAVVVYGAFSLAAGMMNAPTYATFVVGQIVAAAVSAIAGAAGDSRVQFDRERVRYDDQQGAQQPLADAVLEAQQEAADSVRRLGWLHRLYLDYLILRHENPTTPADQPLPNPRQPARITLPLQPTTSTGPTVPATPAPPAP